MPRVSTKIIQRGERKGKIVTEILKRKRFSLSDAYHTSSVDMV